MNTGYLSSIGLLLMASTLTIVCYPSENSLIKSSKKKADQNKLRESTNSPQTNVVTGDDNKLLPKTNVKFLENTNITKSNNESRLVATKFNPGRTELIQNDQHLAKIISKATTGKWKDKKRMLLLQKAAPNSKVKVEDIDVFKRLLYLQLMRRNGIDLNKLGRLLIDDTIEKLEKMKLGSKYPKWAFEILDGQSLLDLMLTENNNKNHQRTEDKQISLEQSVLPTQSSYMSVLPRADTILLPSVRALDSQSSQELGPTTTDLIEPSFSIGTQLNMPSDSLKISTSSMADISEYHTKALTVDISSDTKEPPSKCKHFSSAGFTITPTAVIDTSFSTTNVDADFRKAELKTLSTTNMGSDFEHDFFSIDATKTSFNFQSQTQSIQTRTRTPSQSLTPLKTTLTKSGLKQSSSIKMPQTDLVQSSHSIKLIYPNGQFYETNSLPKAQQHNESKPINKSLLRMKTGRNLLEVENVSREQISSVQPNLDLSISMIRSKIQQNNTDKHRQDELPVIVDAHQEMPQPILQNIQADQDSQHSKLPENVPPTMSRTNTFHLPFYTETNQTIQEQPSFSQQNISKESLIQPLAPQFQRPDQRQPIITTATGFQQPITTKSTALQEPTRNKLNVPLKSTPTALTMIQQPRQEGLTVQHPKHTKTDSPQQSKLTKANTVEQLISTPATTIQQSTPALTTFAGKLVQRASIQVPEPSMSTTVKQPTLSQLTTPAIIVSPSENPTFSNAATVQQPKVAQLTSNRQHSSNFKNMLSQPSPARSKVEHFPRNEFITEPAKPTFISPVTTKQPKTTTILPAVSTTTTTSKSPITTTIAANFNWCNFLCNVMKRCSPACGGHFTSWNR